MELTPALVAPTLLVVLGAAILRGLTGFGFAIAAVPLLGLLMEPARAVPLALTVAAFGGMFGVRAAARVAHWPSLRRLAFAAACATPLGGLILKHISADMARLVIAAFTLAALIGIARRPPVLAEGVAHVSSLARDLAYGFLAGLFNGLAAMPGPPAVAYYMNAPLNRESVRGSLMGFFQFTGVVGVIAATWLGLIDRPTAILIGLGVPLFLLGNALGGRLFALGSETTYRRIALASLAAMALGSAIPAVRGLMRAAGAG